MSFFAVYLLVSLKQRASGAAVGATYIGFTVNPQRRIRQHNGDIVNGAKKTSRHRPWEMVLVCYGFPSQRDALQFEWAWQHPNVSIAVREMAATLPKRGLAGVKGKVRLLMEMLHLEKWKYMPLQVQFLSSASLKYLANCPAMPSGMEVGIASLEALPTTCPEDFDLEESGDISTGPCDNSDCLPAALVAEAVQDCATSPLPESCSQGQCAPPKQRAARRRGRPPKAQAPAAATASAPPSANSPAKAARPRGRPRKATAAADDVGSHSHTAAQPKAVRTQSARAMGADRRTGSPDSSNSKQRSSASPAVSPAGKRGSSAAASAAHAASVALPDSSPKRARGRPKKVPAPPPISAAAPFATDGSPIVLSGSDVEARTPSPASRSASSVGAADSLSSASCIDLLSDADSDTSCGLVDNPRDTVAAPARDRKAHGRSHGGLHAVAQQACDADGTALMCTPQPAPRCASTSAPASPRIVAAGVAPMLTPQPAQQLEPALTPMLCSPPMASPPAYDSSPPVLGFEQQMSTAPGQGAADMRVPVICLLTPE